MLDWLLTWPHAPASSPRRDEGLQTMKKLPCLVLVVLTANFCAVRAETVALWLFDDPPGSRTAVDVSGNGYHLTLGPDAEVVEGGKFGNALDANARSKDFLGAYRNNVETPLNPADSPWTLECWVKTKPSMEAD